MLGKNFCVRTFHTSFAYKIILHQKMQIMLRISPCLALPYT